MHFWSWGGTPSTETLMCMVIWGVHTESAQSYAVSQPYEAPKSPMLLPFIRLMFCGDKADSHSSHIAVALYSRPALHAGRKLRETEGINVSTQL